MDGWYFLASGSSVIAFGLSVTAVTTRCWTQTAHAHIGLWKGCIAVGGAWFCTDTNWPDADPWIPAVKGLVLTSIVLAVLTMVFALMAYLKDSSKWTQLAACTTFIQELVLAVGLFTFLGYINKHGNRQELSWSYFFGWVSVGFCVMANIFFAQSRQLRIRGVYQNIN